MEWHRFTSSIEGDPESVSGLVSEVHGPDGGIVGSFFRLGPAMEPIWMPEVKGAWIEQAGAPVLEKAPPGERHWTTVGYCVTRSQLAELVQGALEAERAGETEDGGIVADRWLAAQKPPSLGTPPVGFSISGKVLEKASQEPIPGKRIERVTEPFRGGKPYSEQTPAERFPGASFHWHGLIVGPFATVEACQLEYDRAYRAGEGYQPPIGVKWQRIDGKVTPTQRGAEVLLEKPAPVIEARTWTPDQVDQWARGEDPDAAWREARGNDLRSMASRAPTTDPPGEVHRAPNGYPVSIAGQSTDLSAFLGTLQRCGWTYRLSMDPDGTTRVRFGAAESVEARFDTRGHALSTSEAPRAAQSPFERFTTVLKELEIPYDLDRDEAVVEVRFGGIEDGHRAAVTFHQGGEMLQDTFRPAVVQRAASESARDRLSALLTQMRIGHSSNQTEIWFEAHGNVNVGGDSGCYVVFAFSPNGAIRSVAVKNGR